MYIDHLKIENVRGFGEGQIDLSLDRGGGSYAGWTVFAGRNGSGKTTLLRALALAVVGPRGADRLQESFVGWVHADAKHGDVSVHLTHHDQDHFDEGVMYDFDVEISLRWSSLGLDREPSFSSKASLPTGFGPWAENITGWFLAGYGPFRRLSGQTADAQRLMRGSPAAARLGTLFRDDASLLEGLEWLRDLRLRQADGKPGATELLTTAFALLNDGLLPDPDVRVERYDADGLWVSSPRGGVRPVGDLSDGYRAVIALVLDLVRALHQTYGDVPIVDGAVDLPGVVLIDEVDAHLHVSWQQRIGPWLKAHFPKIQFLVTSHSPFVCQAADKNGLILLPTPGTDEKARIADDDLYHRAVNGPADAALLSDLFGLEHTWSDASEKKRVEMARLEGRILHAKASDVDRAQPKSVAPERTFEWNNHVWACGRCNKDKAARYHADMVIPTVDDPLAYLDLVSDGRWIGSDAGGRGQATLDALPYLNRQTLMQSRAYGREQIIGKIAALAERAHINQTEIDALRETGDQRAVLRRVRGGARGAAAAGRRGGVSPGGGGVRGGPPGDGRLARRSRRVAMARHRGRDRGARGEDPAPTRR